MKKGNKADNRFLPVNTEFHRIIKIFTVIKFLTFYTSLQNTGNIIFLQSKKDYNYWNNCNN